jgi:hypothetical protein
VPHDVSACEDCRAARAELRESFRAALCNVLRTTQLPPITVMETAAEMVGAIYREIADAHSGAGACACGWRPAPQADLAIMQRALATGAAPNSLADLAQMIAQGRA